MQKEMTAGPELDAMVAEKLFGWRWLHIESPDCDGVTTPHDIIVPPTITSEADALSVYPLRGNLGKHSFLSHHKFSTDISAAWKVVEKMHERGECISISWATGTRTGQSPGKCSWGVQFRMSSAYASNDSLPLAICLAALRAVEGKDQS